MKITTIKRLYHGTDQDFETFDFNLAKKFKDFGKGFYLTSNLKQAQRWAQRKSKMKSTAYIYEYMVDSLKECEWKVLELLCYDENWVDFISGSRMAGLETDYDIIYDRIADNQFAEISYILQEYRYNKISADKVIDRIRWDDDDADQYCFKNERALTLLKDRNVFVQHKDEKGRWKLEKG